MDNNFQIPVDFSIGPTLYERFQPRHIALAEQVAQNARQKSDLGNLMYNAQLGVTPDEQEKNELQQRLNDLTAQFVESTKDLDDSQYQQAAQDFVAKVGGPMPQRQTANLDNPNLMQSGFALLAAALDPGHAAQTVSQPLLYQQQRQQETQGRLDQNFALDMQSRKEGINAAETRMNVEERKLGKAQASQDRQSAMLDRQIRNVQDSLDKLEQRQQVAINQAFTNYNSANKPDEKMIAGKRLQALLLNVSDPNIRALAPDDATLTQTVESLRAESSLNAARMLDQSIKQKYIDGIVDEADVQTFEKQAQEIAKMFGISRDALPSIQTGRTVMAGRLKLAEEQFGFLKTKTREDFKIKWAQLQVARQRAETYAQAVANGFQLGTGRLNVMQGNLAMRQYESSLKAAGKSAKATVQEMLDKIKKESDPKAAAKLHADLNLYLQNTAQELGLDLSEYAADPLGAIGKVIDALNEQEQSTQYNPDTQELKGEIPGSTAPFPVNPGSSKQTPRKPAPKKQSRPVGKLPSGWKYSG